MRIELGVEARVDGGEWLLTKQELLDRYGPQLYELFRWGGAGTEVEVDGTDHEEAMALAAGTLESSIGLGVGVNDLRVYAVAWKVANKDKKSSLSLGKQSYLLADLEMVCRQRAIDDGWLIEPFLRGMGTADRWKAILRMRAGLSEEEVKRVMG